MGVKFNAKDYMVDEKTVEKGLLMTIRNPSESFDDYKARRKHENLVADARARGTPFFVSRSTPFKNKDGEKLYSTGTYIKGQDRPINVKVHRVTK